MRKKHKAFKYGMKAAALYAGQVSDRVEKLKSLGLEPIVELHLFGKKDIFDQASLKRCITNCRKAKASFYVHFPVQDAAGYGVYDPARHSDDYFKKVVDFCGAIKAKALIMHRVYGIGEAIPRVAAAERFNGKVLQWARYAMPLNIYIENYSFIWLPEGFGRKFVVSPIDHFFSVGRGGIFGLSQTGEG